MTTPTAATQTDAPTIAVSASSTITGTDVIRGLEDRADELAARMYAAAHRAVEKIKGFSVGPMDNSMAELDAQLGKCKMLGRTLTEDQQGMVDKTFYWEARLDEVRTIIRCVRGGMAYWAD